MKENSMTAEQMVEHMLRQLAEDRTRLKRLQETVEQAVMDNMRNIDHYWEIKKALKR
jgi:hypothetical protein